MNKKPSSTFDGWIFSHLTGTGILWCIEEAWH